MKVRVSSTPRGGGQMGRFGPLVRGTFSPRLLSGVVEVLTSVRFVVQGDSMLPNFSGDQYILVSRRAMVRDGLSRGDVVVLRHPVEPRRNYIKRVIGLSGERIRLEGACVYIDDELIHEPYLAVDNDVDGQGPPPTTVLGELGEWTLGEDQLFVMGDNRASSDDSRSFGPLNRCMVVGKAWVRYWPRSAWGILR